MGAALAPVQAETLIGLTTGGALVTFDSATPAVTTTPVTITGLQASTNLVGIDLRPSTGVLYGLGSDGALYTLNVGTGVASLIGSLSMGSPIGTFAGIDFNPVPDLAGNPSLRITTGNAGQENLRANVNAGFIGTTVIDTDFGDPASFFSAVAYTNNDRDPATATSLYGIRGGDLYQVTNPNAGTHLLVGSLGIGGLIGNNVGFDVSGFSGVAFASLTLSGGSSIYTINLTTGSATLLGSVNPNAFGNLVDITAATQAPPVTPIPEPETYALMAAGLAGLAWARRRRR